MGPLYNVHTIYRKLVCMGGGYMLGTAGVDEARSQNWSTPAQETGLFGRLIAINVGVKTVYCM